MGGEGGGGGKGAGKGGGVVWKLLWLKHEIENTRLTIIIIYYMND